MVELGDFREFVEGEFIVVVVVEGPGTLTLEPIYRDRAGSETAGPMSLITFPLALFPLVLPQHNFLYGPAALIHQ